MAWILPQPEANPNRFLPKKMKPTLFLHSGRQSLETKRFFLLMLTYVFQWKESLKVLMEEQEMNIDWLGHDTTRITTGDLVIYIDPYQIKGNIPADIILVSHEHYDHCSLEDIKKIQKNDTVLMY
jgi:hypothetical protein